MMKIPERFAAAFDEGARVRSCKSSGSEHSEDLSDLVNSFLEREFRERRYEFVNQGDEYDDDDGEKESISPDFESAGILTNLFDHEIDAVKRSIHAEVQKAYNEVGGWTRSPSPDVKRLLMARLRSGGFDAGICKSKWEKIGNCPSGNYEYIDILDRGGNRYIVEVCLAGEFSIARPTVGYSALLQKFPRIYVGKAEELKQVVRVMCDGIRRSMRSAHVHLPPWRRHTYMHSKWFASYKRTTNEIPTTLNIVEEVELSGKKSLSFDPVQSFSLFCREEFVASRGVGLENLAVDIRRIML